MAKEEKKNVVDEEMDALKDMLTAQAHYLSVSRKVEGDEGLAKDFGVLETAINGLFDTTPKEITTACTIAYRDVYRQGTQREFMERLHAINEGVGLGIMMGVGEKKGDRKNANPKGR